MSKYSKLPKTKGKQLGISHHKLIYKYKYIHVCEYANTHTYIYKIYIYIYNMCKYVCVLSIKNQMFRPSKYLEWWVKVRKQIVWYIIT